MTYELLFMHLQKNLYITQLECQEASKLQIENLWTKICGNKKHMASLYELNMYILCWRFMGRTEVTKAVEFGVQGDQGCSFISPLLGSTS